MKLLDFVVRDAILVDLQATGKEEAIREMVGSLHRAGRLADNDVESVIRAILGREELGSTGIGQGVAVSGIPGTRSYSGSSARSPCRAAGSTSRPWTASPSISSSCWSRPRTSPVTTCGPWRIFPDT